MSVKTHMKNFWQSNTVRQLAGATAGMIVAGGLYVGFEQLGSMKLTGMLVEPNNVNITENAGEVSTAHENVDEDTARRLGQRAQQVADQMKQLAAVTQPEAAGTPVEQRTQQRLAARQSQMEQFKQAHAAAPTYAGNSGAPVDQRERLAQRAEQNRQLREAAETAAIAEAAPKSVDLEAIRQLVKTNPALAPSVPADAAVVAAVEDAGTLHSGAPLMQQTVVTPPKAKTLASSGSRENLLIVLTLAGALGMYLSDPVRRARFVALVTRS